MKLNSLPKLGKRIGRRPKDWAIGIGAVVLMVLLSKWTNIPFAW